METHTSQEKELKQQVLDLYTETDDWVSNLDYLSDEARFFNKFIKDHLSSIDKEISERIEQFQKILSELELKRHLVRAEVINHRETLELLLKDLSVAEANTITTISDITTITERHENLRSGFNEIGKLVREFKDQFYDVTEDI